MAPHTYVAIFHLLVVLLVGRAHAALPVFLNKPVLSPSDLGVSHTTVPDSKHPHTTWHLFARCTRDAVSVRLTAFVLREQDNVTIGPLGFPVDAPPDFIQLGVDHQRQTLRRTPVLNVALHPAHIDTRIKQTNASYSMIIQAAASPLSLDACIHNATLEEPMLSDNPSYYVVYAGLQGVNVKLAAQVLRVHTAHYKSRGFAGIRVYLSAANIKALRKLHVLDDILEDGFVQVIAWEPFAQLMGHPRYLHVIGKHHAALAAIGRSTWLFFPDLDEIILPRDACTMINEARKVCAQGNTSVLMPVYNAVCRTCNTHMSIERATWTGSNSLSHILQSYEQITNVPDKDTGFIGYQLAGDPAQAYPWIWSSSKVWYRQGVHYEPLIRLEDALSMWNGSSAPHKLPDRECLFVLRFPGLLFRDDVMRLDKVYEWLDFPTYCGS